MGFIEDFFKAILAHKYFLALLGAIGILTVVIGWFPDSYIGRIAGTLGYNNIYAISKLLSLLVAIFFIILQSMFIYRQFEKRIKDEYSSRYRVEHILRHLRQMQDNERQLIKTILLHKTNSPLVDIDSTAFKSLARNNIIEANYDNPFKESKPHQIYDKILYPVTLTNSVAKVLKKNKKLKKDIVS
jgi:hypothetical protein